MSTGTLGQKARVTPNDTLATLSVHKIIRRNWRWLYVIARNKRLGGKILPALVLLAVLAFAFLLYMGYEIRKGQRHHLSAVSVDERRSVMLYDIRENRLVTHLGMDEIGEDIPVQYTELAGNGAYVYVGATATPAVFEAVWETVGKAAPVRKNEDLANVSGCIYFKGSVVRNVRLASVDDLVKTIMQQSAERKRREIPYEKGEEWRRYIVDVTTALWRLQWHFFWSDD